MANNSSIEWTEATWNPVAGCTVISPGCTNCYAMRMAARLERMNQSKYANLTFSSAGRSKWNGRINLDRAALEIPRGWKKGRVIFVNSMSDLLHEKVPDDFILDVFRVMSDTPQHTYQLLTKRAERLSALPHNLVWPANVWMGVSVEDSRYLERVDHLRVCGASIKFLSLEPLIGSLDGLSLSGIHWVIAGGESGPGARKMEEIWVREIRDLCLQESVPFHFKQWGGTNKKATGRVLDGRTWDDYPTRDRKDSFHAGIISN